MKRRRSHLLSYLLLNVVISAATVLVVLVAWNHFKPLSTGAVDTPLPGLGLPAASQTPALPALPPAPTETLPPVGTPLIEIVSVVGAGDPQQEVVMLRRQGTGNLRMTGWKLQGEHNNAYVFPSTPELILYQGGAVQIYTRAGTDTATELYINRDQALWQPGETLHLLDSQGNERAKFAVP